MLKNSVKLNRLGKEKKNTFYFLILVIKGLTDMLRNWHTMTDRQTDSKTFYWMRTFALIAVVMAHANYLQTDSQFLNRLIASFSDCGVAVFFFASGAYWRWRPHAMILKHIAKLLQPWIILGSLVYSVSVAQMVFRLLAGSFGSWGRTRIFGI